MEAPGYLMAITNLFIDLNANGVRYCHWKSNRHLDMSLSGLTDLDLLVERDHGARFRLTIHQHGVKPMISASSRQYPGIEDYLGFDEGTGRLFHLHVHYQLVLGEQFVKNYRLPMEQALLKNTKLYAEIVNVPSPELEIIVLAIRALLKYRDRDVIKDILSIRTPGIPNAIQDEFKYLFEQTDLESISQTLDSELDLLPSDVLRKFLSVVINSPRSGFLFYRLRERLRHGLAAYKRHSHWRARSEYLYVLLRRRLSFLISYSSKKNPVAGGMMIAVVGADGSGKTTVVNELCCWLSWKLNVCRYYLGSQEPSQFTKIARLISRVAMSAQWRWRRLFGEHRAVTKALDNVWGFLRNLYHLSTAWDRYSRYEVGRRQALQGAIVIYDRYPLEAIHQEMSERPMDGPRIAAEAGGEISWLTNAMSRIEQHIYRRITPPDHLFILHVSPHVSHERKSDHDYSVIDDKSRALEQMDKQGLHVTEIDADQSLEQVLLQIKTNLWDLL